ncbi:MAG TPA: HEAT repeat domain-containing protein [Chloroflexia bacterium]|nr:HEAT repeat domain-containing protein [Chloroflexia bacterium]
MEIKFSTFSKAMAADREVLLQALKSSDFATCKFALEVLGELRENRATEPLINFLKHPYLQYEAALALRKMEVDVIPLLLPFLKSENSLLQEKTIGVLAILGDHRALEGVVALLKENGDEKIRATAARNLHKFKTEEALSPLVERLLDDSSSKTRDAAAFSLGLLHNPQALPYLLKAVEQEKDQEVRDSVIQALGSLGDRGAEANLLTILEDEALDTRTRVYAASSLAEIGSAAVVDRLKIIVQKEPDNDWAGSFGEILAELNPELALEPLLQIARRSKDNDIDGVVKGLGYTKSPLAVETLLEIYERYKHEEMLAEDIVASLGQIGIADDRVVTLLASLLDISSARYRGGLGKYAARALASLGTTGLLILEKALNSGKVELKRNAVVGIASLDDKVQVKALLEPFLQDEDKFVRFFTREALDLTEPYEFARMYQEVI